MVFALAGDSTITSLVPGFASVFLVVRFTAGFSAAVSPSSALAALVLVVVFFVVAFFAAGFFAAFFFAAVFFAGVSSGCAACWAVSSSSVCFAISVSPKLAYKFYGNTAQFPPCGLSTAPAAAARHLRCQNAR